MRVETTNQQKIFDHIYIRLSESALYSEHIKNPSELLKFQRILLDFTNSIRKQNYQTCNELIRTIDTLIGTYFPNNNDDNSNDEISNKIFIIKYLKDEYFIQKQCLYFELEQKWDDIIRFETDLERKTIRLICNEDLLREKIFILGHLFDKKNVYKRKLGELSGKTMGIFELIGKQASLEMNISQTELTIVFKGGNVSTDHTDLTDLKSKLQIVIQVLKFLKKSIFSLHEIILGEFSSVFLETFLKFVYQQLIMESINVTEFNLHIMNDLCDLISQFETDLIALEFIIDDQHSNAGAKTSYSSLLFVEFKSNIHEIYVRKKCKHLLDKTRDLIKSKVDLFNFHDVNECDQYRTEIENLNLVASNGFLIYPSCKISEITRQLIVIIYGTLNEALRFVDDFSFKNVALLCLSAKNIFDIYMCVMPTYHKEDLQNFPILSGNFKFL